MPNNLFFEHVLEYLLQGKQVTIRVKGNSMLPSIRDRDLVLLSPFELKMLTKGIIVLAKSNDKIILHRVVRYDKETLWLAGDHNLVALELVYYADVLAIVTSVYRGAVEVNLNQSWRRHLGQMWYLMRPFRRIVMKLIKNAGLI